MGIAIVVGPQGCGKTRNAEILMKKINATKLLDRHFDTMRQLREAIALRKWEQETVLVLTHEPPKGWRKATDVRFHEYQTLMGN